MPRLRKVDRVRRHARRRFRQRVGETLTPQRHDELVRAIQAGLAEFIERPSRRVSIFRVDELRLVYDRRRKLIVTVIRDDSEPEN